MSRDLAELSTSGHNLMRSISSSVRAFLCAIVKFGGAGAFVRGHSLGVLERSTIFQIRRDSGRVENMAADRRALMQGGSSPTPRGD
jgi:hypothetical protein